MSAGVGGTKHTLGCQGEVYPEMVKASCRRFLFSSSFALVLPSLIVISLVYPCCKFTFATDTLLPGHVLNSNQSLLSKNGTFKLGYDCSTNQDYRLYCGLGIWFANSSYCKDGYFPVWLPEIDPFSCDSILYNLSFSEDGVLQVNMPDYVEGYPCIWSSNLVKTTSTSTIAVLLDNGNLVIRDQLNSSMVIWQSFDNPSDVLLPGGRLGFSPITGKNATLVSYSNFYSISYTLSLDATRTRGFIIQQNLGGRIFSGTFPKWIDIHEDGDHALIFNDAYTFMHLDRFGIIRFVKQWECSSVLWSAPESACSLDSYCGICDIDSYCGPYGLCTVSRSCICPDVGFYRKPMQGWTGEGCLRKAPLSCESAVTQPEAAFYPIDGIQRYPKNASISTAININECGSSCLRDCTCTAFAYKTSCLLWFGELQNTVVLDSRSNGNRMYIRIGAEEQQSDSRVTLLFSFRKIVIVLPVIGVLALIIIGLILVWRCRRKLSKARIVGDNGSLMVFSFVQIKSSTKNFSEKLGGGGFGCVFKGTIPVSTTVAVKKLKDLRQGDKQFRTEVQTIGMIQHTNLVRLLGFCADDSRRLLVYEYMVNGSLNSHLFSRSSAKLGWELRYSVALGTARGLAYLHEECKDRIVHCDLKPDNILLDELFCPKIADFGMAKLLGRDYSRVLTTMRGTIGYLAPEWISGVPITHKADVYSYGMMLLEIISGRRNSEKIKEGKHTYFPIYAAVKVNENDAICLLDSSLEGNADVEQLNRACRVACWCIQDAEDHRPMMSQVVRMLEGVMDVEVPPVPRSLQNYVGIEDSISADMSISEVSYY